MSEKNNYDGIIHMDRYEFRDQVADEVEALKIKQELLQAKQSKLEKILEKHNVVVNKKGVDYIYNKTKDEYLIKVGK